jgi:hypothetical protein
MSFSQNVGLTIFFTGTKNRPSGPHPFSDNPRSLKKSTNPDLEEAARIGWISPVTFESPFCGA